jgi:NAD(P)-dependent dehydrogenase (short-subunit alcohol dehydrogenase family)
MADVVVVTGASGALGSTLVGKLAVSDRLVVAVGRGIDQASVDAMHGGGRVLASAFDVSALADWEKLIARLKADGHTLTGAVLAAGAWRGGEKLHEQSDSTTWQAMLSANFETVRVSLAALLPGMVAQKRGSIVAIGSMAAARPWEQAKSAAYSASKAAVLALAQAVAAEVLADGVRVNVVLPSTIDTPANRKAMPKADTSRWVQPESLGDVITFLLSDAARDISGAALPVYGRVTV